MMPKYFCGCINNSFFEALKFAIEAGFQGKLVLEGDNLAVVNALINEDEYLEVGGVIIENIICLR